MSLNLIVSILIRLIALGWAVVMLHRLRDWRIVFLAVMVGLMALRQTLTLLTEKESWSISITGQLTELPGLAVSVMALLAVVFMERIIRERRRIEDTLRLNARELQAAGAKFQQFLETAPDAIVGIRRDGRIVLVNVQTETLFGYTREELLGQPVEILLPERFREVHVAHCVSSFFKPLTQPMDAGLDLYGRRKDRSDFPVEIRLSPLQTEEGVLVTAIIRDITERKRAEELLRMSEQRLRNTMDGLGPYMFVGLMTTDGTLIEANRPALEVAGLKREDVIGKPFEETYWWSYSEPVKKQLSEAIQRAARGEASRYDVDVRASDNRLIAIDFCLQPLADEAGRIIHLIPSAVDITKRRRIEESLRELSGRLLQLQDEERRRMARELHDTTAQNLAALAVNLSLLNQSAAGLDPRASKTLSESLALADQCSHEIRTFSYLLHPPLLDELGLASALRAYIDGFVQRSGLHIDLDVPPELGWLPREVEVTLFRIVQESLTNIHLHSGSPTAKIRILLESNEVALEVSDEGRGIPLETLRGDGLGIMGLGVGIVGMQARMRQLGGRLEIHSGSQGTTVKAILPRVGSDS